MPAFFVALRESVHDPKEMRLYADKAAGSAAGHRLVTRVAYCRLRMTYSSARVSGSCASHIGLNVPGVLWVERELLHALRCARSGTRPLRRQGRLAEVIIGVSFTGGWGCDPDVSPSREPAVR